MLLKSHILNISLASEPFPPPTKVVKDDSLLDLLFRTVLRLLGDKTTCRHPGATKTTMRALSFGGGLAIDSTWFAFAIFYPSENSKFIYVVPSNYHLATYCRHRAYLATALLPTKHLPIGVGRLDCCDRGPP